MTQGYGATINYGKETLSVSFAPFYNDFENSFFAPIQRFIKLISLTKLGMPAVSH